MKKKFVVSLIVALVFLPAVAMAEKLVFVTTEWAPFMFRENGKLTGTDVEIIQELCKRLAIEPDIKPVPWKRALKETKDGRADAIFFPRYTEERAEFLYFTSEPASIEKTVIIARKESNIKAA